MENKLPGWLCVQRSSYFRRSKRRQTTRGASGSGSAPRRSILGASPTCKTSWLATEPVPSRASRERRRCWTTNSGTSRQKTRWKAGPRGPSPPREGGYASGPKFLGLYWASSCMTMKLNLTWAVVTPEQVNWELSLAQATLSHYKVSRLTIAKINDDIWSLSLILSLRALILL